MRGGGRTFVIMKILGPSAGAMCQLRKGVCFAGVSGIAFMAHWAACQGDTSVTSPVERTDKRQKCGSMPFRSTWPSSAARSSARDPLDVVSFFIYNEDQLRPTSASSVLEYGLGAQVLTLTALRHALASGACQTSW